MTCRDCRFHQVGPITGFEYCGQPKSAAADRSFVPLEFISEEREPGGTVLDPFCGSGSTGAAAISLGFSFIGIERDHEYAAIAERRLSGVTLGLPLEAA